MIIFLLFLSSILMAATNLPDFSAQLARPFQQFCTSLSPVNSNFHELYTATICGVNPSNTQLMWDFRNTGLFHLIVVSGAHLSFLATLIMFFPPLRPRKVVITVLIFYALASGLNPPIVRALVAYFIHLHQKRFHLGWSAFSSVMVSGLICLTVFPAWWSSLSFIMSWLASIAVTLPGSNFRKSAYCYVLLLLPMSQFQWNHPLTIVFNLILAPILGFIVLPFSLLPFLCPPLVLIGDFVWTAVAWIVSFCSRMVSSTPPMTPIALWIIWVLLFGLHFWLYRSNVRTRRAEWKTV